MSDNMLCPMYDGYCTLNGNIKPNEEVEKLKNEVIEWKSRALGDNLLLFDTIKAKEKAEAERDSLIEMLYTVIDTIDWNEYSYLTKKITDAINRIRGKSEKM